MRLDGGQGTPARQGSTAPRHGHELLGNAPRKAVQKCIALTLYRDKTGRLARVTRFGLITCRRGSRVHADNRAVRALRCSVRGHRHPPGNAAIAALSATDREHTHRTAEHRIAFHPHDGL